MATLLIHNCLLSPEDSFNLLSVSQLQASHRNSVDFALVSPQLHLTSSTGTFSVPLCLTDGLHSLAMDPLSINDVRYSHNPHYDLTEPGPYVPLSVTVPTASFPSLVGDWTCRMFVAPSPHHRVLAFPSADGPAFGAQLKDFCDRRTYDTQDPLQMSDMSVHPFYGYVS
jgi:hypothetical protein